MAEKRYYWLKLYDDFFGSKRIKKMRRLAGGDTLTIIYLKMQLKAMKTDGILSWTGVEDNFAAELALDLDESAENVALLISYLLSCGLCELSDDQKELYLPYAVSNVGSEGSSAQRVREHRARSLHCNADVTAVKQISNGEIEIDIDTREREKSKRKSFTPPTLEEVQEYCAERGNKVDAERWFNYYSAIDFYVGKKRMVDWKSSVRYWERSNGNNGKSSEPLQSGGNWGVKQGIRG